MQRSLRPKLLGAGSLGLLLFACASRAPADAPTLESCLPELSAADFEGPDDDFNLRRLEVGEEREIVFLDKLVYGLRLQQGDEVTDMTLEFTAIGRSDQPSDKEFTLSLTPQGGEKRVFRSNIVLTTLLIRCNGAVDAVSSVPLPAGFLTHGLDGVCKLAKRLGEIRRRQEGDLSVEAATPEEMEETFQGFASLLSMLRIVQGNEKLNDLLERMISLGDMMSIVFAGGLTIAGDFDRAIPCASLAPLDVPAWCFPMTISAGSQPLIHFQVLLTEPRAPLAVTGGLLALKARHAGDPSQRLTLVLIGAKRGFEAPK